MKNKKTIWLMIMLLSSALTTDVWAKKDNQSSSKSRQKTTADQEEAWEIEVAAQNRQERFNQNRRNFLQNQNNASEEMIEQEAEDRNSQENLPSEQLSFMQQHDSLERNNRAPKEFRPSDSSNNYFEDNDTFVNSGSLQNREILLTEETKNAQQRPLQNQPQRIEGQNRSDPMPQFNINFDLLQNEEFQDLEDFPYVQDVTTVQQPVRKLPESEENFKAQENVLPPQNLSAQNNTNPMNSRPIQPEFEDKLTENQNQSDVNSHKMQAVDGDENSVEEAMQKIAEYYSLPENLLTDKSQLHNVKNDLIRAYSPYTNNYDLPINPTAIDIMAAIHSDRIFYPYVQSEIEKILKSLEKKGPVLKEGLPLLKKMFASPSQELQQYLEKLFSHKKDLSNVEVPKVFELNKPLKASDIAKNLNKFCKQFSTVLTSQNQKNQKNYSLLTWNVGVFYQLLCIKDPQIVNKKEKMPVLDNDRELQDLNHHLDIILNDYTKRRNEKHSVKERGIFLKDITKKIFETTFKIIANYLKNTDANAFTELQSLESLDPFPLRKTIMQWVQPGENEKPFIKKVLNNSLKILRFMQSHESTAHEHLFHTLYHYFFNPTRVQKPKFDDVTKIWLAQIVKNETTNLGRKQAQKQPLQIEIQHLSEQKPNENRRFYTQQKPDLKQFSRSNFEQNNQLEFEEQIRPSRPSKSREYFDPFLQKTVLERSFSESEEQIPPSHTLENFEEQEEMFYPQNNFKQKNTNFNDSKKFQYEFKEAMPQNQFKQKDEYFYHFGQYLPVFQEDISQNQFKQKNTNFNDSKKFQYEFKEAMPQNQFKQKNTNFNNSEKFYPEFQEDLAQNSIQQNNANQSNGFNVSQKQFKQKNTNFNDSEQFDPEFQEDFAQNSIQQNNQNQNNGFNISQNNFNQQNTHFNDSEQFDPEFQEDFIIPQDSQYHGLTGSEIFLKMQQEDRCEQENLRLRNLQNQLEEPSDPMELMLRHFPVTDDGNENNDDEFLNQE